MNPFKKLCVALAVASISSAASAGILIDDFSINQAVEDSTITPGATAMAQNDVGQWSEVTTNNGSILGGARDLFVSMTSGNGDPGIRARMSVFGDALRYSTDSGAVGLGYVRWDGDTGADGDNGPAAITEAGFNGMLNATGLGGLNLAASATSFAITILESDLNFNFGLQVFTDANNWTLLLLAAQNVNIGSPVTRTISFADFAGGANENGVVLGSGALRFTGSAGSGSLSNVGALQAIVNPNSLSNFQIDLAIDTTATVPEPSALALVGLGLLGAGLVGRRRRA